MGRTTGSNGVVTRGEEPGAVVLVDLKAGLLAVLGADMNEFCAGIVDFDVAQVKIVDIPRNPERIALFVRGQLQASVWPFVQFDCALFTAVPPVATGLAIFKNTDNDVAVSALPNAAAYGFTAFGTLYDAQNSPVEFSAVFRALWDKENDAESPRVSKIRLR